MQILLKDLLKEVVDTDTQDATEKSPLKVQIYCDMDGVLADMEKKFEEISGGVSMDDFKDKPEFQGNQQKAQREFWKLINSKKDFWQSLDVLPGAKQLWDTMKTLFVDPKPVVLSAGQGFNLISQKQAWFQQNIDATVPKDRIIIAQGGTQKANHAIKFPSGEYVTHILVDDTQRNIDAWKTRGEHFVGILHNHEDVQNTIRQLQDWANKK